LVCGSILFARLPAESPAVAATSTPEPMTGQIESQDPTRNPAGKVLLTTAPGLITSLKAPYPSVGSIERLDPALDALLAPGATMEKLADGFNWSEGPVWMPALGALLFSDVPENRVYRWKDGEGISVFLTPSGFTGTTYHGRERGSNGLTLDRHGRLVLCQHGDRRVARLAADGKTFEPIVDRIDGKRFSSPNDLCIDRAGNLFFTDPPYGLPHDEKPETEFNGVYRLGTDGKLTVITREMERPNGIALSPDERTLYVGSTHEPKPIIMAFALREDGSVASSRVFFDGKDLIARTKRQGGFDGMKIDTQGNLWTTGPGGLLILSPAGKHLGSLLTGQPTANCAFGGPDGKTLFITANHWLLSIKTNVTDAGH
jgi:gluconolactonase